MPRAILFTLVIFSSIVQGEDTKSFKQEGKVLSVLESYIACVDEKNVEGMLEHIIIPLDLHFGSQQVTTIKSKSAFEEVFNRWNNSEKSNFHVTKIKSVNIFVKTGFSLTVLFVFITILVSIFTLNYYNKTLVEVDFLHGLAESFLTLSDFVILFGFIKFLNSLEVNNS